MMLRNCTPRSLLPLLIVVSSLIGTSSQSHKSLGIRRLSSQSIGAFASPTLTFSVNVSSFTTRYRSVEPLYFDFSQPGNESQTFALILSRQRIGSLQVEQNNCTVEQSNASFSLFFRRLLMLCRFEKMSGSSGYMLEVNMTIINPTIKLNGSQVILKSTSPRSKQPEITTAIFTIKYCDPQAFRKEHLQVKQASKSAPQFQYNDVVYLECSSGLLFKYNQMSHEAESSLLLAPVIKSCGPHGDWNGPTLGCWQGQTLVLPSDHNFVEMDDRPAIFLCRSTSSSLKNLTLQVGDSNVKSIVASQAVWQNLSLETTGPKHPVTVRCEEHAKNGEIVTHKISVYVSHYNINYIVYLGSPYLLNFPIPLKKIKQENIHVIKDGKPFHNFNLVFFPHKGHHHARHAIAFNFRPAVTEADLGTYVITINYSGRTFERLLHVVAGQNSASKDTVTGVVVGVIASILLLCLIVGVVVWKLKKSGRLVHSSSMEHMVGDQSGFLSQDDVFYPAPGDNEQIKNASTEEYQGTSFTTPSQAEEYQGTSLTTPSRAMEDANIYTAPSRVRRDPHVDEAGGP